MHATAAASVVATGASGSSAFALTTPSTRLRIQLLRLALFISLSSWSFLRHKPLDSSCLAAQSKASEAKASVRSPKAGRNVPEGLKRTSAVVQVSLAVLGERAMDGGTLLYAQR